MGSGRLRAAAAALGMLMASGGGDELSGSWRLKFSDGSFLWLTASRVREGGGEGIRQETLTSKKNE